ncbi:hypothetical protein C8F01DRAFT_320033 [Mycena amicta]|nr:hypothetical protein C8F01DRAFT_320033 [Mycena amicta]
MDLTGPPMSRVRVESMRGAMTAGSRRHTTETPIRQVVRTEKNKDAPFVGTEVPPQSVDGECSRSADGYTASSDATYLPATPGNHLHRWEDTETLIWGWWLTVARKSIRRLRPAATRPGTSKCEASSSNGRRTPVPRERRRGRNGGRWVRERGVGAVMRPDAKEDGRLVRAATGNVTEEDGR